MGFLLANSSLRVYNCILQTKELSEKSQHLNLVTREAERLKRGVREVVNQQAAQESLKVRIAELATERDAANVCESESSRSTRLWICLVYTMTISYVCAPMPQFELQEADKMLASLSELESSVARSATSDEVDQLMLSTTPSQLEPIHVDGQQHASLIKINDAGLENSRWFLVLKRLHQSFGQLLFKVHQEAVVHTDVRRTLFDSGLCCSWTIENNVSI